MEDKNDTLNENKIPVMSSQRATYIMNVCTGRILIEDIIVMDIVAVSNFVYHISQWQSVTPT
jgi:predicted transcriptional regulator